MAFASTSVRGGRRAGEELPRYEAKVPRSGGEKLVYSRLGDLAGPPAVHPGAAVNVYALVVDATEPRQTRGRTRDYVANFSLTDASLGEAAPGGVPPTVTLNLFASNQPDLPHPVAGDILRLHRVHVNIWEGRPQLMGKVGCKAAWALFPGARDAPDAPTRISSHTFSQSPAHAQMLAQLRAHGAALALAARPALSHRYVRKLADLTPGEGHVDLVGRILAARLSPGMGGQNLLWLWDGTDTRPFQPPESDADVPAGQPDMPLPGAPPQPGVLVCSAAELPLLGSALPVVCRAAPEELPLKYCPERGFCSGLLGGWVKLRNVFVQQSADGHLLALFHHRSKWSATAVEADVEEDNRQRVDTAVWAPASPSLFGTALDPPHPSRGYSTLRALHLAAGTATPAKFRVLARITGHWPLELVDFCSRRMDKETGEQRWVWTVKLFLEDATARLGVLLWDADAVKFFAGGGLQACDLRACPQELHRLTRLMAHLLKAEWPPTWVDCCVRSFYRDKSRPLETVSYRMFDTVVQPPRQP